LYSGVGDNGSQVAPIAGTGCWLLSPPPGDIDSTIFGAKADGATDNTGAMQYAWNYAASIGKNVRWPSGSSDTKYIKISRLTAPIGALPMPHMPVVYTGNRSRLVGDGVGQTVVKSTVTGTDCAINYAETYGGEQLELRG